MGQAEKDRQNKTPMIRLPGQNGQDWQNKTPTIGIPRQDGQKMIASAGLPE
jgi:hypothetical protein